MVAPACRLSVEELFAAVDPTLCRLALVWARRHRLDADDVLQEARAIVWAHAASYDAARTAPARWARAVAVGAVRNVARSRVREEAVQERLRRDYRGSVGDGLAAVFGKETAALVNAALGELPEQQERIFRRYHGYGCPQVASVHQLAAEEGCHHSTITRQLDAATAALRAALAASIR